MSQGLQGPIAVRDRNVIVSRRYAEREGTVLSGGHGHVLLLVQDAHCSYLDAPQWVVVNVCDSAVY
ncbi:MAG TPA: hypothetical protein PLF76_00760 [Methanomassiliicoccaceae archaeon]|nr:hypothetical protein [Methanomassiliicoccaceae archaeon]